MITMNGAYYISIAVVSLAAFLFRMPFLNFPMDEDFAFHTYRGWFRDKGIKWKKDVFIHFPQWKSLLLELVSGTDYRTGMIRLRLFLALVHALTSALVFHGGYLFTGDLFAGAIAGMFYAFFATVPALYSHSFNMEQLYVPLMLSSYYMLLAERYDLAGLMLGLAWTAKYSALVYIPVAAAGAYWYSGAEGASILVVFSLAPITASLLVDFAMGLYRPSVAAGLAARFANTVRLAELKKWYGNPKKDFMEVAGKTFPVWIAGPPALLASMVGENGVWHLLFLVPTFALLPMQKFFSRYHYLPIIAVLALGSAGTLDFFLRQNNAWGAAGYTFIFVVAAISAIRQAENYIRPTDTETLADDRKFDQFIYIPRLGKAIKRLARMRGETGRIFVWGNYTQLYPYTGMPAADKFIHYSLPPWDTYAKSLYCQSIFEGMVEHRPRYVILAFKDLDMKLMQQVTGLKYRLIKTAYARFPVYQLVSDKNANPKLLEAPWEFQARLLEKMMEGRHHGPGINRLDVDEGYMSRALKEGRKAVRINPQDVDARLFVANVLEGMGRLGEAENAFRRVVEKWPDRENVRLSLAYCLISQGKLSEALPLIDEEEKVFGESGESHYTRGIYYKRERDFDRAEEYLNKALNSEASSHDDARLALAETRLELGRREEAAELVNILLKETESDNKNHQRARAAILLANTHREIKDQVKTIKTFLDENPTNEILKYAFASKLDSAEKKEAAAKIFRSIISNGRNEAIKAGAYYRLALYLPNGERADYLRKCLRLLPSHRAAKAMLEEMEYETAQA